MKVQMKSYSTMENNSAYTNGEAPTKKSNYVDFFSNSC